ncbi:MAG: hypothetical protein MUP66_02575 [Candidatus Nanohaloarchaeota archaeon QJJ-5]|nr:hypothetical protein [Candidatus Nanohaloarchaeota archaeon QJJ-5]
MLFDRARRVLRLIREDDGESLVEYERLVIFLLITIAAFIYLGVLGILVSGQTLTGPVLYVLGAAVMFDLIPEIWLFRHAREQKTPVLKKLQDAHYYLEVCSYLLLGIVVLDLLPISQFMGYALFLLIWLCAFLIGEAVMILTGRFTEN